MELRQLKYFVAVAEELNFGRAAARLLIAGPSLSQQIKARERDLGVVLFNRDHRSVALTPAGAALLPDVRALLDRADELRRHAERLSGAGSVHLGYVNWLPANLAAHTSGIAQLHVDTWVLPSHAQAARVADGSLDLAVCWVRTADLAQHGLQARLLGADQLYAVSTGTKTSAVRARDVTVLVDGDAGAWSSWNVFAGITGANFFDHVRAGAVRCSTHPRARPRRCRRTSSPDRWSTRR